MYILDCITNDNYFIVLKNNDELFKISKKVNTLESIKKHFKFDLIIYF